MLLNTWSSTMIVWYVVAIVMFDQVTHCDRMVYDHDHKESIGYGSDLCSNHIDISCINQSLRQSNFDPHDWMECAAIVRY